MSDYTLVNLKDDVEDMAPKFGLSPGLESHFARVPLELTQSGLSYYRVAPGFRLPFGHTHEEQEEVYVVVSGSARMQERRSGQLPEAESGDRGQRDLRRAERSRHPRAAFSRLRARQ